MADDLTATLAGIKERQSIASDASLGFARMEERHAALIKVAYEDTPRLLAAVEAVLKEHQPVNRGEGLEPICSTCHRGFWPCPTYEAITREPTGGNDGG
jgi:hypothetical protein